MRSRALLGDLEAVRVLRRALARQLAEIDAEPWDETISVAYTLIANLLGVDERRTRSAK
jgi:hypothetical protein